MTCLQCQKIVNIANIRTVIVSSIIRMEIGNKRAKYVLGEIDNFCEIRSVCESIHNQLELHRIKKRRRV